MAHGTTVPDLVPEAHPGGWLSWGNDFLGGVGTNPDDNRTNEIQLGLRADDGDVITIDHSILTHLYSVGDVRYGDRIDQLTISGGHQFTPDFLAGLGWVSYDDWAGQDIQNGFHRLLSDRPIHGTYERRNYALLLFCEWDHETHLDGRFWLDTKAGAVGSTEWTLDGYQAALVVFRAPNWHLWAGPRLEERVGHRAPDVVADVTRFEQGLYGEAGIMLGQHWSFDTRYQVRSGDSVGAVTYYWRW